MTGLRLPAIGAIALLVAVNFLGAGPMSRAADQPALSPAQIALFETAHLAKIRSPVTLDYSFHHDGPEAYDDTIALVVRAVHEDGAKDLSVRFLSGDRRVDFPSLGGFHGNPLIMYFLEWDVRGMQKAAGGSALYFRNRLREALVDRAEVEHVSVTLDGRSEPATAIVVQPYRDDPGIARYAAFRDKSYRFVLSDGVPGMVYELGASLPAGAGRNSASVDRVTYVGIGR